MALGLGAATLVWTFLDKTFPFHRAFAWEVVGFAASAILLSAAWFCAGSLALRRVFKLSRLPPLERVAIAGPLGAICWLGATWAFGAVGLLGKVFAVGMPVVFIVMGAGDALAALRSLRHQWRRRALTALELGCMTAGVLVLGFLWLGVLTPDVVNYDASWNHMVIAEGYAREGRIFGFEGDWVKDLPHAGSLINTWAFLVPWLDQLAPRCLLALQLEFFAVLWTLVGVAALASRLLAHRGPRGTWAVIVLFPALAVYDMNIGGAADHYCALYACAAVLCAMRAARRFDVRWAALAGALLGGMLATKMQALFVAVPLGLMFAVAAGRWAFRRQQMKQAWRALAFATLGLCAAPLPHWVCNTISFGNPLYPLGQRVLGGHPTAVDGARNVDLLLADYNTQPTSLLGSARVAATFAFVPHYSFTGVAPSFGFLFTVLTPGLLLVRRRRALAPGVLVSWGAVCAWAATVWVDRNLQSFAPLLWAASAALIVGLWDLGVLSRVGLVATVGVQLTWGAGMFSTGADRAIATLRMLQSQTQTDVAPRWASYRSQYTALAKGLPKEAVVLLHNSHVQLGIDRRVLLDWIGFQGLIDYPTMPSMAAVQRRFGEVGATHVVWRVGDRPQTSRQSDILFAGLTVAGSPAVQQSGDLSWLDLKRVPALPDRPLQVWVRGVAGYADGLYDLPALSTCEYLPADLRLYPAPKGQADEAALAQSDVLLLNDDAQVPAELRAAVGADFVATHLNNVAIYFRKYVVAQ